LHPGGRFEGIERPYSVDDVLSSADRFPSSIRWPGAARFKLWELLKSDEPVRALGAVTGNQAMQMVRAGLKAIYLSGWQAAADANTACSMYPDQSLYPANTGPELARRINRTLQRADQIEHMEGGAKRDWFAPIVADAEAGFGGPLNCFEIMKAYIEAGVAGVHFEDQLASEKKCGHLGGKVLIPTKAAVRNLDAARLAADVSGVPTILIARTDAESAKLLTSDVDERDRQFITGERTAEGFYRLNEGSGLDNCISRRRPSLPMPICCGSRRANRTSNRREPSPKPFTANFPARCSPTIAARASTGRRTSTATRSPASRPSSERWATSFSSSRSPASTASTMGCSSSRAAIATAAMAAYSELQQAEFASEADGYTATRHQREVGTGYFDAIASAISGGEASTVALESPNPQFSPRSGRGRVSRRRTDGTALLGRRRRLFRLPLRSNRTGDRNRARTLS
jgi:isocitrate lyase